MKKFFLSIVLALFMFGSLASAMIIGQSLPSATGGCDVQWIDQSHTTYNTASNNIYSAETRGQSFTPQFAGGGTKEVYSITIWIEGYGTANVDLRFDDDNDLTVEYLANASNSTCNTGTLSECEIVFPAGSRPTVQSGQTYYYLWKNTKTTWSDRIVERYDSAAGYTGGVRSAVNSAWGWNSSASDAYFKVKLCGSDPG